MAPYVMVWNDFQNTHKVVFLSKFEASYKFSDVNKLF